MKRSHFALPEIYDDSLSYYDVLRKLIKSMHLINDNLNKIPEQIANEAKARLLGDQNLQQNINAETSAREQADQEIREGVSDKISELKGDLSDLAPAGAAVGQLFRVAAISEDGKYTMEPVDMLDVQINGESIVQDGVAVLPVASVRNYGGIVRLKYAQGFASDVEGFLQAYNEDNYISNRFTGRPLELGHLDYAVKVAMCDGKGAAWTAEEQAAARERLGINDKFQRVFLLNEIWEEGTSLIVDVNSLSHFRIFISLGAGIISSVDNYGLISCTDSNGNRTNNLFELGNLSESNLDYDQVAYCKYDINDVPTMSRWGGSGGNPSYALRGELIRVFSTGDIIPNFLVSKIHFPKIKGDVKIAIWGY